MKGKLDELRKHENEQPVTTLSDNLLLQRISQGDTLSFETVFHHHYDKVYGLLFRLVGNRAEAEDIAQEVFLKLYYHAYESKFFAGKKEHNIGGWLYQVATNMGYNAIRGRKRQWQRDMLLVPDEKGGMSAEQKAEKREEETAVRRALTHLQPRQVQLLLMRQMEFSYAECAEACGVSPSSVGTLLARAAEAFRKAYLEESNRPE